MSKPAKRHSKQPAKPPEPVDVRDGIPDRSPRAAKWKYVALLVVFLGWVAFLVYVQIAGRPRP